MIWKKSLFQHYHVFISRALELTISHVLFTVKTLLFPEIYLWIHVSLHPSAVEPRARIGFLSGDQNDAKYALKIKYTHKNEEVRGLTTGYSPLVTQPVSNCNQQDLQCVCSTDFDEDLRDTCFYLFFSKTVCTHWEQEKKLFDSYQRLRNQTRLMAMWIKDHDPNGGPECWKTVVFAGSESLCFKCSHIWKYHPTRTTDLERVIPVPRQDMDGLQIAFGWRLFFAVMSPETYFFSTQMIAFSWHDSISGTLIFYFSAKIQWYKQFIWVIRSVVMTGYEIKVNN